MKKTRMLIISVFDHWLSEEEAQDSKIITYSTAKKNDVLNEYLEGEKNFIELYKSLAKSACCYTKRYDNKKDLVSTIPSKLCTSSANFQAYLINGLRERHLHHFHYIENDIVVRGGFDRTDSIIINAEDKALTSFIRQAILSKGLFILADNLLSENEYLEMFE